MSEEITAEIARILWRYYETSLPDTPRRMAVVVTTELRKRGFLTLNDDPSKQEGREANATI